MNKMIRVSYETRRKLEKVAKELSKELGIHVTLGEAVKILAERALKGGQKVITLTDQPRAWGAEETPPPKIEPPKQRGAGGKEKGV